MYSLFSGSVLILFQFAVRLIEASNAHRWAPSCKATVLALAKCSLAAPTEPHC